MFIYILVFTGIILTAFIAPRNKNIAIFWLLFICFLSVFRAESVGTDTKNYTDIQGMMQLYEYDYDGVAFSKNMEVISSSLYEFVYNNSLSSRTPIVFFSLVTFMFLFLALKRSNLSYSIGLMVFLILFYLSSFNIARQICACSIVLYSYTFLFKKSKKRYLFFVFVLIASFIHVASIFFIVLYPIRYINKIPFNKKILIAIATFLFLLNIISPINLSEYLTTTFGDISFSEIYSERAITGSRSIMGILQDVVKFVSLILIFNYGRNNKECSSIDFLFYLSIIATIFSANAHSDVARIFLPLEFFQILYLPYLYHQNKNFIKSPGFLSFVTVYTFFTLWGASIGSGELIPYVLHLSF